jgi:hypothetical protein
MFNYRLKLFILILIFSLALYACTQATPTSKTSIPTSSQLNQGNGSETVIPANATENPLTPEKNPVGDIPDNQVFIQYSSPTGGYSLEVPEGWARSEQRTDVLFIDKFDGISVALTSVSSAPTVDNITQNITATLAQTERAFELGKVSTANLPGGSAVYITATANSDPDPVTGKQVRLEEEIFMFYQNGKLATLKLWAPQGADNVDQWKRISESFTWK